jgi:hypothetical protein
MTHGAPLDRKSADGIMKISIFDSLKIDVADEVCIHPTSACACAKYIRM